MVSLALGSMVSLEAAMVVASILPLKLLADHRKRLYDSEKEKGSWETLMIDSQSRWDNLKKLSWTYHLIPRVEPWYGRKFGDQSYWLSQFLTAHEAFKIYLYKRCHADNEECPYCGEEDTPEHIVFQYIWWINERRVCEPIVGTLQVENIITKMLENEWWYCTIADYIAKIMKQKDWGMWRWMNHLKELQSGEELDKRTKGWKTPNVSILALCGAIIHLHMHGWVMVKMHGDSGSSKLKGTSQGRVVLKCLSYLRRGGMLR